MLNKDEQELEKLMKTSGKIWNLTRVLELGKIWIEVCEGVPGASVRKPARDKVMRKEADIRKACSDFRDPSGNS